MARVLVSLNEFWGGREKNQAKIFKFSTPLFTDGTAKQSTLWDVFFCWRTRSLTHLNLCSPSVLYFSGISESAGAKQNGISSKWVFFIPQVSNCGIYELVKKKSRRVKIIKGENVKKFLSCIFNTEECSQQLSDPKTTENCWIETRDTTSSLPELSSTEALCAGATLVQLELEGVLRSTS